MSIARAGYGLPRVRWPVALLVTANIGVARRRRSPSRLLLSLPPISATTQISAGESSRSIISLVACLAFQLLRYCRRLPFVQRLSAMCRISWAGHFGFVWVCPCRISCRSGNSMSGVSPSPCCRRALPLRSAGRYRCGSWWSRQIGLAGAIAGDDLILRLRLFAACIVRWKSAIAMTRSSAMVLDRSILVIASHCLPCGDIPAASHRS